MTSRPVHAKTPDVHLMRHDRYPLRKPRAVPVHARVLLASIALLATALLLAACSDGAPPESDATGTTVVGVELSETTPATFDSGQEISGVVHIRTDETEGIHVWLMPPGDPSPGYAFQASGLLQGPDIRVQRYFLVATGDDDRTLDAMRVVARNADFDRVLDEEVSTSLTIRSVANTAAPTLDPASGTLMHGDRVQVSLDFTLDDPRSVEVSVGPMRPTGYDDATHGAWTDVRDIQDELFTDVGAGTMNGSFTITDAADGDVTIDTLYVSIRDLNTMNTIYIKLLDVDFTFTEPDPADLAAGVVEAIDDHGANPVNVSIHVGAAS